MNRWRDRRRGPGEVEHGLLEILLRRDHHTRGAIVQGALFLPRSTDGADDAGTGFHGKLRGEQADAPANGVDEHRLPGLEAVKRMQHVIAGHRLDHDGGTDIKRNCLGQRHQNIGGSNHLLGIRATLFHEGRDPVANLHAADAWAELRDRTGNLKAQDQRIGERVRIDPVRICVSAQLQPANATSTKTSPGPGLGSGRSAITSCSGPPGA